MVLLPEGNELGITSGSWSISTWFTYPIEDNGTLFRHALTDAEGVSYVAIQKLDDRLLLYDSGSDYLDTDYSINTLVDGWHNLIVVSDKGDEGIDFLSRWTKCW